MINPESGEKGDYPLSNRITGRDGPPELNLNNSGSLKLVD